MQSNPCTNPLSESCDALLKFELERLDGAVQELLAPLALRESTSPPRSSRSKFSGISASGTVVGARVVVMKTGLGAMRPCSPSAKRRLDSIFAQSAFCIDASTRSPAGKAAMRPHSSCSLRLSHGPSSSIAASSTAALAATHSRRNARSSTNLLTKRRRRLVKGSLEGLRVVELWGFFGGWGYLASSCSCGQPPEARQLCNRASASRARRTSAF